MQKNMIFSGLNNVLTEGKNLKMKRRNIESIEDNFNFGKYNTLLEIKKELNEETKNDNDYFNKQNHLFKHNSLLYVNLFYYFNNIYKINIIIY